MMKTFFGRLDIDDLWTALSFRLEREKDDKSTPEIISLLEIRKNETGVKQVRRSKPLKLKAPDVAERCTIYIENLPSFVTNDSLKKMFSDRHGSVDYVSLPRYKHNRAVKGFAFVEFEDILGAEAAIKMFEGGKENTVKSEDKSVEESQRIRPSDKDPAELQSIKSFQLEQSIEKCGELPKCKEEIDVANKVDSDNPYSSNTDGEKINVKEEISHTEKSPKEDTKLSTTDENVKKELKKECDTENETIKKRKKRHKNKKININMQPSQGTCMTAPDGYMNNDLMPLNGGGSDDYVFSVLRVMTKEEWRKMRNKYLNLQKQNMSVAKGRIRQMRTMQKEKHKEVQQTSVHVSYPSQTSSSFDTPFNTSNGNKNKLEYTPGIIVRFKLEEPIIDQGKQVKSRLRAAVMEPVKYVDATNGSSEVYVRCSSQKQAETITSAKGLMGNNTGEILTGKEESNYWEKIRSDREDKISGKVKVKPTSKKERGKDRVVKNYEQAVRNTHKFFEEGAVVDD